MPANTEKQRRFMGVELARLRAARRTKTGMPEGRLEDFARKPTHPATPDKNPEQHERSHERSSATSLLIRRLRFGSEWL